MIFFPVRLEWGPSSFYVNDERVEWDFVLNNFELLGFTNEFTWIRCPKCQTDSYHLTGCKSKLNHTQICASLPEVYVVQPTTHDFTNCRQDTIYEELCSVCTDYVNVINRGKTLTSTDVFYPDGKVKTFKFDAATAL